MKTTIVVSFQVDQESTKRLEEALSEHMEGRVLTPGSYELRFQRGDTGLGEVLHLLKKLSLPFSLTEERNFRRRELEEAPALHLAPNIRVPQEPPPETGLTESGCPVCGARDEEPQELVLEGLPFGNPGLTTTRDGRLLVNEELARVLIRKGITGCLLRGVRDVAGRRVDYFELLPMHTLPPLHTPPTRIQAEEQQICPCCHKGGLRLVSMLYFDAALERFLDMNRSAECFGSGPCQWHELVISQRLFRIMVEHGVDGLQVEPVVLV